MKEFLLALRLVDPDKQGKTAHELIDLAKGEGFVRLRDAIIDLVGRLDARSLGNKLKSFRLRMHDGLYLGHAGEEKHAKRWTARDETEIPRG